MTAEQEREAVVRWLRDKARREFIAMPDTIIPGYFEEEYGEERFWVPEQRRERFWVPEQRRACSRLPTHNDYADAIEAGEHIKETSDGRS